ncbi:hemophore-related protein [soil metagenome]
MTQSRVRLVFAAGVTVAAATLIVAPTASALPLDGPLIETSCTYPQIEAALRAEAPQAADRLADNPQAQSRIQELLALPVDQRRQRIQGFLDRNPDVAQMAEERRASPEGQEKMARMTRVAETCPNY